MAFYNIFNGFEVDPNVYPSHMVTEVPPPAPGYEYVKGVWVTSNNCVNARLECVKHDVYTTINNKVIEMYKEYAPLFMEYTQRETQALNWRDRDFAGDPPPQVLAVSVPAKMNPIEACNLIIYQAQQFREALDFMASLRMKKMEVEQATSINQARQIESETMASITNVLANLP